MFIYAFMQNNWKEKRKVELAWKRTVVCVSLSKKFCTVELELVLCVELEEWNSRNGNKSGGKSSENYFIVALVKSQKGTISCYSCVYCLSVSC